MKKVCGKSSHEGDCFFLDGRIFIAEGEYFYSEETDEEPTEYELRRFYLINTNKEQGRQAN